MPPAARVRLALPAPTMPDVEPEAEAPVVLPLPRRHEDPAPPETVVVPALPVEPEPERQDSIDFASTLATEVPDSLIAGRLESLPEAAAEEPPAETSATEAASIQSPPVEPVTVDDLPPTEAEAAPAAEPLPASEPAEPAAEIAPPVAVAKVAERPTDPEPEPVVAPSATYLVATDFELESATWRELSAALTPPAEPVATVRDEPPPPPVVAVPVEVPPAPPQPEEAPRPIAPPTPAAPEPPTVPTPLAGVSEWPSAKVILEQYRRDRPTPAEAPPVTTARPPRPLPQPTVEYAPRGRTVSGPVGVGIAAALALVLGSGTMALSWAWAQDDRLAGVVADQLVRADGAPRRVGIPEEAPARSWWRSTADHLYLHALARAVGAPNDPARAEEARALLDAARSAAPLQRQVRLVLAAGDAPAVGLSRDPLALRLAGRRLLREGKVEPALGVYREALDLLDRIDLAAAPVPPFVEAPEVRRFALPGEAVLAPILEDLAAAAIPPEARARWLDGLPRRAILGLALFRFHQGRGEASEAGHAAALAQAAEPPASPAARALHHAALAELLALSGRPQEAADRYREAVAALPEGTIRRTWALNLGELEARLGHEDEVRSAWALARGDDPDDAVNLRLVDARRRRGQLVEPPALLATPTPPPGRRDEGVRPADFRVPPGGPHGRPWAEPR
jgi:tetratricopeptide (TPR) repeat protein